MASESVPAAITVESSTEEFVEAPTGASAPASPVTSAPATAPSSPTPAGSLFPAPNDTQALRSFLLANKHTFPRALHYTPAQVTALLSSLGAPRHFGVDTWKRYVDASRFNGGQLLLGRVGKEGGELGLDKGLVMWIEEVAGVLREGYEEEMKVIEEHERMKEGEREAVMKMREDVDMYRQAVASAIEALGKVEVPSAGNVWTKLSGLWNTGSSMLKSTEAVEVMQTEAKVAQEEEKKAKVEEEEVTVEATGECTGAAEVAGSGARPGVPARRRTVGSQEDE